MIKKPQPESLKFWQYKRIENILPQQPRAAIQNTDETNVTCQNKSTALQGFENRIDKGNRTTRDSFGPAACRWPAGLAGIAEYFCACWNAISGSIA
ncbi:MAG: hypothetical protein HY881_21250 [Deltaproteobacteria bacterium]|nr:hypothetical protein [Deltaproteobacteria bacterium]